MLLLLNIEKINFKVIVPQKKFKPHCSKYARFSGLLVDGFIAEKHI